MDWSTERVNLLKKLWLEGLSASQIAKQLGGVTRNAVIGKVHRLGLSGRQQPAQPVTHKKIASPSVNRPHHTRPKVLAPPKPTPQPAPERVYREETPGSATIFTLDAHMCKWPIGDPASDHFTFCGKKLSDKPPYCVDHSRVAFQPRDTGTKSKSPANELARSLRRYI